MATQTTEQPELIHDSPQPHLPESELDLIAERAYQLWRDRGCPDGPPETDWLRAEEEMKHQPSLTS